MGQRHVGGTLTLTGALALRTPEEREKIVAATMPSGTDGPQSGGRSLERRPVPVATATASSICSALSRRGTACEKLTRSSRSTGSGECSTDRSATGRSSSGDVFHIKSCPEMKSAVSASRSAAFEGGFGPNVVHGSMIPRPKK